MSFRRTKRQEKKVREIEEEEEVVRGGRIGRLCLSPRAQLRRHHGDRCLHSPQFEQCPAVLGRTAHSFALFHVAGCPPHSALSFSLSPFSSSNAIPGIPRQNERYTNEKDASPFLFTIPAVTADGKKQECAYGNRRGRGNGGR